jgi:hypothetical protein
MQLEPRLNGKKVADGNDDGFMSQRDMAEIKRNTAIYNSRVKRGELPAHNEKAIQMPKPEPKQNDLRKVERLGFDPKWSFRKRPQTKKR